jgi:hypothetical protein
LNQRELIEESSGNDITPKVKSQANAHLHLRRYGVALRKGERTIAGPVRASDRASELRAQRAIFRAMKKLLILEKAAPNR